MNDRDRHAHLLQRRHEVHQYFRQSVHCRMVEPLAKPLDHWRLRREDHLWRPKGLEKRGMCRAKRQRRGTAWQGRLDHHERAVYLLVEQKTGCSDMSESGKHRGFVLDNLSRDFRASQFYERAEISATIDGQC